jgi:hypothetical protein
LELQHGVGIIVISLFAGKNSNLFELVNFRHDNTASNVPAKKKYSFQWGGTSVSMVSYLVEFGTSGLFLGAPNDLCIQNIVLGPSNAQLTEN